MVNGTRFTLYDQESDTRKFNVAVNIRFESALGLKAGTRIRYLGMDVGHIEKLELDHNSVIARSVLDEDKAWLAREGSEFWLVKPQLGLANVAHLETLLTGQYINIQISDSPGKAQYDFIGLIKAPDNQPGLSGLNLELTSHRLGSIRRGNPVYYRDIPVGQVTGYRLDNPASQVVIYINIEDRYQSLVSDQSRFWNASGIDMDVSLLKGAKIRMDSLEALLAGGISFATPNIPDMPLSHGQRFTLYSEAKNWTG